MRSWMQGLALMASACSSGLFSGPSPVGASDVVQLNSCPSLGSVGDGGAPPSCTDEPPADGQSVVVVQACSQTDEVSSDDRRTDMGVTLHATRGSWLGHTAADPTSVTVSLGASPCGLALLVADQTPGINEITGTLLGYTATKQIVQIPAAIGHVDVVATSLPPLQGTAAATIQLTTSVHTVAGGFPSAGTRVDFEVVNVSPAGINVPISPTSATLDASGTASLSTFVPATVTAMTVQATVTPPSHPELGVAPLASVQGHLDIQRQ